MSHVVYCMCNLAIAVQLYQIGYPTLCIVQSAPDTKNHEIQMKNLFFITGVIYNELCVNVLRSVNIASL